MSAYIYCKTTSKGKQTFYLFAEGNAHYLFTQNFRRGVKEYFEHGVSLSEALDFSRAKRNASIIHTMEKLPSSIRYIEREYGLKVLKKTVQKNSKTYKKCA